MHSYLHNELTLRTRTAKPVLFVFVRGAYLDGNSDLNGDVQLQYLDSRFVSKPQGEERDQPGDEQGLPLISRKFITSR